MQKEIKQLYSQLNRKGEFITAAAEIMNLNPASIKANWLSSGGNIPLEYQKEFKRLLKKALKEQDKYIYNLKK